MTQEINVNGIWITWEDHRRSRELANAFNVKYCPLTLNSKRIFRYPYLTYRTILLLLKVRANLIFCQNPSIVLTSILVFFKSIFGYKLIVDRHSNFKFEHENSKKLKWRMFWLLSEFTIKKSDLTIVTNNHLMRFCENFGGRSAVLPDRIPKMTMSDNMSDLIINENKINVMFVCTFSSDEPILEILEAAKILGDSYNLYFTGNAKKFLSSKCSGVGLPSNVIFTGFISESDYSFLMSKSDVVLVLTGKEYILNCGAYEAVALGRPLVLSNTETIKSYFYKGVIYVGLTPEDIALGIRNAFKNRDKLLREISELKDELSKSWSMEFESINRLI